MSTCSTERLFLCKQHKPEIYVDNSELLIRDEITAIRFLYAKFKKNIPGVILNNYGNSVHKIIVCFLQAIQVLLNKPVLILCNGDDNLQKWRNHFQSWADTDLVFKSSNPFIKKQVFINTFEDITILSRQNWGIVIVEDNSFSREILRSDFKASCKIWLLSIDLKRDLQILSQVYSWLYPKADKFDIQKFTLNNITSDRINKIILLNTFFEDILISSSQKLDTSKGPIALKTKTNLPQRQKLKDITGKKIKCSKIQVIDDNQVMKHDIENTEYKSEAKNNPSCNIKSNDPCNMQQYDNRKENTLSSTNINEDQQENMKNIATGVSDSDHLASKEDSMESQGLNFENALQELVATVSSQEESILSQDISLKLETDLSDTERDAGNLFLDASQTASNKQNNETAIESSIEDKEPEQPKSSVVNESSSLDSKLRELEEKALKRFKGSFLDSIF